MLNIISTLLTFVFNAIKYLLGFLTIVILGVVGAVLYALPWLLRAAALLVWLGGAYVGITSIQTICAPFSPAIPVIALQFAVILILVAWITILLRANTKFFWGGMAAGGLVAGGAASGAAWLLEHWQYADLFLSRAAFRPLCGPVNLRNDAPALDAPQLEHIARKDC
jgi:hypothetical protein